MSVQPTIVLVHGFWGGAAHWGKVIVQLSKLGYAEIRAVENPLTSLADDVARGCQGHRRLTHSAPACSDPPARRIQSMISRIMRPATFSYSRVTSGSLHRGFVGRP